LPARATAFQRFFFASGKTAPLPLPARATAFQRLFFASGKTAPLPLPARAAPFARADATVFLDLKIRLMD
jgi:hypothetical protein